MPKIRATLMERVWSKIERDANGCWLWTGAIKSNGYGNFSQKKPKKRTYNAHRFVYELLVEPIPAGLCLDHLCRVRRCVNPAHLEIVTYSTNIRRGLHSGLKTHHACGHARTPENQVRNGRDGSTRCRVCNVERNRVQR